MLPREELLAGARRTGCAMAKARQEGSCPAQDANSLADEALRKAMVEVRALFLLRKTMVDARTLFYCEK